MTERINLCDALGNAIHTWDAWPRPKRREHWAEGRSAMELARAWFAAGEARAPSELTTLFESHELTRGLRLDRGQPELTTALPPFKARGPRHHDLSLTGNTPERKVTVCVEGKADEAFGNDTVERRLRKAGPTSAVPARVDILLRLLFGPDAQPTSPAYASLPYQLLTGAVGTLLQAERDHSALAVFVVHEFHTALTKPQRLRKNARALDAFVRLLPSPTKDELRRLTGPFVAHETGDLLGRTPLLVGKALRCTLPKLGPGACVLCSADASRPGHQAT